jgi:hypothetical protein
MDELPDLKPVKLTCTSKDCANDLHLYRPGRGEWKEPSVGVCQGCGDTSVDMTIPRARDLDHPEAIFAELGREFIREHFLQKPFDERARRLIHRDGLDGIKNRVHDRLARSIGGEPTAWDGRQTKLEGNVLFYAQHATATCCRKCAWYWYGIPHDGVMDDQDISFCEGLVNAYIDRRADEISAIHAEREGE